MTTASALTGLCQLICLRAMELDQLSCA